MGKGSAPAPPTPPTAQEIADANIETAEHMAKLSRAMEFGEELLKSTRNEDGSSVRYERLATDIPTGYEPIYTEEAIDTSGPQTISGSFGEITVDRYGKTEAAFEYRDPAVPSGREKVSVPAGTLWSDLDWGAKVASGPDTGESIFSAQGSQPFKSYVKTLTGYESPTGDVVNANQYYRIDTNIHGETTRSVVERDEAVDVDFSGMGDIDRAVKRWEWEKEYGAEQAEFLLDFADEYGDDFVVKARDLLEKSDPTGFAARELLGQLAQDYTPGQLPDLPTLEKSVDPDLLERAGVAPFLPEIGLGDVPEYERAGAFGDLERLGAAPTLEELTRAEAPGLERAAGMDALRRAEAAPEFGQIGAAGGIERAGEMAGLGRLGDTPTMRELGAGPGLERAGELDALGRLKEFSGYERAGEMGGLERAGEMAALERRGAGPTLAELQHAGPSLERAGEMGGLERLAAFGGLERAGAMGGLERAGAMSGLERAAAAPSLERLTDIPEVPLDAESMAAREFAEEELLRRAQSGETSRLMGEEARRIARGRAAGLGNIFGGGAAIEEAAAVRQAEDAGQRAAVSDLLNFYGSGQTAGDYQSRIAQQNLSNRLMGIQQRTGAEQAEFGMGMQRLGADREAALQERADQLGSMTQRNQAEEQEYRAALQTLDTNRQAVLQEYGLESQRRSFANEQALRERQDQLGALGQRTAAEQAEYSNLQNQLAQINMARQAQFGMGGETLMANRQAQMQEQASRMETLGQRTGAQQAEYQAGLQAMGQRTAAAGGEYGFEAQRIDQQNAARLQERADQLGAITQRTGAEQQEYQNLQGQLAQINAARQAQFGMEAQGLGINQQAQLQERADQLAAIGQRTGAQQQEYQNLLSQLEQQNMARERGFQADIQAAGFDNEAALRERTDQLTAIGQRTAAEQQEFSNLTQIVGQINQTRGGQFGLGAQAAEFNTSQRLRERADELSAMAQRNQAEEGEYQSLLSALGQQGATRQAQYGQELQGIQQRNVASEADLARQQQSMAQRNQAAQQSFASAMQKTMSEEQLKQQQMANLQSFSGLTPVAAQFGALQGAQQGVASSYQPIQYQPTNVGGLLQGQQNLAASVFGNQAEIYKTQAGLAAQPSGFAELLGTGVGVWAGMK